MLEHEFIRQRESKKLAERDNRIVRDNEIQSTAEQRERQFEEQKRIDAERAAREARKKASAAKKNAKEEITKAKRHAEKVISETKRKLSFWRMVAVGMFLVGAIIECSHVWMQYDIMIFVVENSDLKGTY